MLSRKPTAIKLTQEDVQHYDDLVAAQQEVQTPSTDMSNPTTKKKGKESAATEHDRQAAMDARIGVGTSARVVRR